MTATATTEIWEGHYPLEEVKRWRRQVQRVKRKLFARHLEQADSDSSNFAGLALLRQRDALYRLASIQQLESIGLMRDIQRAAEVFQVGPHLAWRKVNEIRAAMDLCMMSKKGPQ